MSKKNNAVRKTKKKREERMDEEGPKLSIIWKDWIVNLVGPRGLKYGRTFLYLAAIIDLVGAIMIIVKAIKVTSGIWVIITFACALMISGAFILFVMILATLLEGNSNESL